MNSPAGIWVCSTDMILNIPDDIGKIIDQSINNKSQFVPNQYVIVAVVLQPFENICYKCGLNL